MVKKIYILILFTFLLSCDISSEDSLSPSAKEENTSNVFFTTYESGLSINPTAFDNLKEAKSLTISKLPKFGEAKFLENGFIFYRLKDKNTNSDELIIEGKTQSGTIITEQIKISFVNSDTDLPCFAGAIGDKLSLDAENKIEIDILKNDKTCGNIGNLSIEISPKFGTTTISNNKIIYTPNKDFAGEELFFYRININNQKNPVAPIEVLVKESDECTKGLFDDIINVLNYSQGSELMIDVLQNDKICKIFENAELKLSKTPDNGQIRIDKTILSRPVIMYKANNGFRGQDVFEYSLYKSDKRFIKAKVTLNFN